MTTHADGASAAPVEPESQSPVMGAETAVASLPPAPEAAPEYGVPTPVPAGEISHSTNPVGPPLLDGVRAPQPHHNEIAPVPISQAPETISHVALPTAETAVLPAPEVNAPPTVPTPDASKEEAVSVKTETVLQHPNPDLTSQVSDEHAEHDDIPRPVKDIKQLEHEKTPDVARRLEAMIMGKGK
jgi:hypothetical protein